MKNIVKNLLVVLFPLLVGLVSAILAPTTQSTFSTLLKPPLSPPGWLFAPVWTVLFLLIGTSRYLVIESEGYQENKLKIDFWYYLQLFFNFFWTIIFFRWNLIAFAFVWILFLLISIIMLIKNVYKVNKVSAYLLIPYFIWVAFASYLNLGFAILN